MFCDLSFHIEEATTNLKSTIYFSIVSGVCNLKWKRRFREMIFQTRRMTSSAGDSLVYPTKHGLPASTENVDIKVTVSGQDRGWVRGWWMTPDRYSVTINPIYSFSMFFIRVLLYCTYMESQTVELIITE